MFSEWQEDAAAAGCGWVDVEVGGKISSNITDSTWSERASEQEEKLNKYTVVI